MKENQPTVSEYLLNLLAEGTGIQGMVEAASGILDNPVLLSNFRYKVSYKSGNSRIGIPLWDDTRKGDYISDAIQNEILASGMDYDGNPAKDQIFTTTLPNGYQAMRVPLYYKERFCGFLGTYNYKRPFEERDKKNLLLIQKAMLPLLATDSSLVQVERSEEEILLLELLSCQHPQEAAAVIQRNSHVQLSGEMVLICVKRLPGKARLPLDKYRSMLVQLDSRPICVISKNIIGILVQKQVFSSSNAVNLFQKFLLSFLQDNHLIAGVSSNFHDAEYIPSAWSQTRFVLDRRREDGSAMQYYRDFIVDRIIDICLHEHGKEYYIHPAVIRLAEYDREYHTDNLDTLQVYLRNGVNLKKTAEELGIHYNTVKYRMNNIRDIVGEDWSETGKFFACMELSIRFYKEVGR